MAVGVAPVVWVGFASEGVARVLCARDGSGKLVWGVSVDREIGPSVRRAVGSVWAGSRIEQWPVTDSDLVSDSVPIEEGGGTVVRRYLTPAVLCRPLFMPDGTPDHPMARVVDVLDAHPEVDVQWRIDLVPLSAADRERVCGERLESLGEFDPDRDVWETGDKQEMLAGVRVLLRVARAGAGHASECVRVADRIFGVLDSLWSTDHNHLGVREISDGLFDQIWETGCWRGTFRFGIGTACTPCWDLHRRRSARPFRGCPTRPIWRLSTRTTHV